MKGFKSIKMKEIHLWIQRVVLKENLICFNLQSMMFRKCKNKNLLKTITIKLYELIDKILNLYEKLLKNKHCLSLMKLMKRKKWIKC